MTDTLEVLKPLAERTPAPGRIALMNAIAFCTGGLRLAWADAELVLDRASAELGRRVRMTSIRWLEHDGLVDVARIYAPRERAAEWKLGRDVVRLTQEGLVEQFSYGPEVVR